ncbi:MAG TPA: RuBisCO accumulation factor 1, partial [Trichocoleus sp.]
QAEDPVAILAQLNQLPNVPEDTPAEPVLAIADRAQRTWDADSYFLVDRADQVEIAWFQEKPELPLLGRLILLMRPKRILDENYTRELWQVDE